MPLIRYEDWTPNPETRALVRRIIGICERYAAEGRDLTVRQLYYRLVAADIIENKERSYKRIIDVVNRARMAGLLDWDFIVDRTRNVRSVAHWENPSDIIDGAARQYRRDKWATQPSYVEVWIEKDALIGVVEPVARRNDVPAFSCRGYVSQSEMWGAAQRLYRRARDEGRTRIVILHLGDHDPSGIDMTRDIEERIQHFLTTDFEAELLRLFRQEYPTDGWDEDDIAAFVEDRWHLRPVLTIRRLALNMEQVEEYGPPPNPAKLTDSRARGYIAEHGRSSWELDALEPEVLDQLVEDAIDDERDDELWDDAVEVEHEHRRLLASASAQWPAVVRHLTTLSEDDADAGFEPHRCGICGRRVDNGEHPDPEREEDGGLARCCPGCGCGEEQDEDPD